MTQSAPPPGPALRDVWMDAAQRLEDAGVHDARFEAEVLLRHACGRTRVSALKRLSRAASPASPWPTSRATGSSSSWSSM